MKLPHFDYAAPASLSEAVALLAAGDGSARPLAGGQSFLPVMAFRLAEPSLLVDLRKIPDLRGIEINANGVRIGALVRWRDILDSAALKEALPLLPEASNTWRIIRCAIAARSAAASRTPIPQLKCQPSRWRSTP